MIPSQDKPVRKAPENRSEYLEGRINEVRRRFVGDGVEGEVFFGKQIAEGRGRGAQYVRVKLSNGRNAWGAYSNPAKVRLRLKVKGRSDD